MAVLTFSNFPHSGPNPRTSTTPMNPHHVTEHNDMNTAMNAVKAQINFLENKYLTWLVPNGTTVGSAWSTAPMPDGKFDLLAGSGIVRVGTDSASSAAGATGTWTPVITMFGSVSGTVTTHAETRGTWICLAAKVFFVSIEIRITGAWSNAPTPQYSLPTTWGKYTLENIITGTYFKYTPYGLHFPLIGVIHPTDYAGGGNQNGEIDADPSGTMQLRFLSQYSVI